MLTGEPSRSPSELTREVVIADYDPAWPLLFEQEKALILGAIGSAVTAIEHIGSTSVPGLPAKPIVDIMVGVRALADAPACVEPLARLGYVYRPEFEAVLPDRRYFRKCARDVHTHHLHMAEVDGAFWRRHLAFRDYLRSHPETAQEYGRLKRGLAARLGDNVDAYTDAKTEFISAVETKAQRSM